MTAKVVKTVRKSVPRPCSCWRNRNKRFTTRPR